MNKTALVINTLEYASRVDNGALQANLLSDIAATGVGGAEIRREYIKDFDAELPEIKAQAEQLNLRLFYSVPEELFVNGEINPALTQYLSEGKQMGIIAIKFNIGDFANFHGDLANALSELTATDIQVNVENDQTQTSGTIKPLVTFLTAAQTAGLKIGYVYDLGNWRFVDQDEYVAAETLAPFVRYIHLKDVTVNADGNPLVQPLDKGNIDWRHVMTHLPHNVPIAIEYPAPDNAIIQAGIDSVARDIPAEEAS